MIEMNLIKKNKETWTRIKISVKDVYKVHPKLIYALGIPLRKSSRFYYWEIKGDFLNNKE